MVKKSQKRNLVILLIPLTVILLTAIVLVAIQSNASVWAPSASSGPIKGTAVCLPHKDTSGPQTLECAFGLKDEKGNYYSLSDTDTSYKNIANLPMGEKVVVTGTIEKNTSDTYATVGTIKVTKIERD